MPHRFTPLTATILAIALHQVAPSASGTSAETLPPPGVEILVNGTPQAQLEGRGQTYVEALKGEEYEIRLRNPYPVRVAVALSVDGLNTIDARETSAASARKWVLGPYETVTISGWQTSLTQARRFHFTTEERSYGQALGKTANFGVISAAFFRERAPMPITFTSKAERERSRMSPPAPSTPSADSAAAPSAARAVEGPAHAAAADEYAATGIGRRTDHPVRQVWLDLEEVAVATVNIRYEFRAQLVRLGILAPRQTQVDPLTRREGARGFCPDLPR